MQRVVITGSTEQIVSLLGREGVSVDRGTASGLADGFQVVAYADEATTAQLEAEGMGVTVTMDSQALQEHWLTVRSQVGPGEDG